MKPVNLNDTLEDATENFNVEPLDQIQVHRIEKNSQTIMKQKGARIVKKESLTKNLVSDKSLELDKKSQKHTNCGKINPPFYNPERVFGPNLANSLRKSAPQYSFGTSRASYTNLKDKFDCEKSRSPGPIYNVSNAINYIKKRSPAFTIGTKTRIC